MKARKLTLLIALIALMGTLTSVIPTQTATAGPFGSCLLPGDEGNVCRSSAGVCDVLERCECTATDPLFGFCITVGCPTNDLVAGGTECRPSAGLCDVAETCTGSSATCPGNVFQSSDTECRASAGLCDVAETCTGSSATCPTDAFESSATECRASTGFCDIAENCDGSTAFCPSNAFKSFTTECRASADQCDVAETCECTSSIFNICLRVDCATDVFEPDGLTCNDNDPLTTDDQCTAGVCAGGERCGDSVVQAGEECDDGNSINTDACLDTCRSASCGDSFVQAGVEECEPPSTATCNANCLFVTSSSGTVVGFTEVPRFCGLKQMAVVDSPVPPGDFAEVSQPLIFDETVDLQVSNEQTLRVANTGGGDAEVNADLTLDADGETTDWEDLLSATFDRSNTRSHHLASQPFSSMTPITNNPFIDVLLGQTTPESKFVDRFLKVRPNAGDAAFSAAGRDLITFTQVLRLEVSCDPAASCPDISPILLNGECVSEVGICTPGLTRPCGTSDVGVCQLGTQLCDSSGRFGSCTGNIEPTIEACDGFDNDCDGAADETFDLSNDRLNCGSCGNECSIFGEFCAAGTCQSCTFPNRLCADVCVDTFSDENNCGSCGNACSIGETCVIGTCEGPVTCGPGETLCPGAFTDFCANLQTSGSNCGSCGNACSLGLTCQSGICSIIGIF